MKYIFVLMLLAFVFASCENKINPKDIETKNNVCYINNKPVNNEVWSNDNQTICLTMKDGKIVDVKAFHENNKAAITIKNAIADSIKYFDENGKEIEGQKFNNKYQNIYSILIKTLVESGH